MSAALSAANPAHENNIMPASSRRFMLIRTHRRRAEFHECDLQSIVVYGYGMRAGHPGIPWEELMDERLPRPQSPAAGRYRGVDTRPACGGTPTVSRGSSLPFLVKVAGLQRRDAVRYAMQSVNCEAFRGAVASAVGRSPDLELSSSRGGIPGRVASRQCAGGPIARLTSWLASDGSSGAGTLAPERSRWRLGADLSCKGCAVSDRSRGRMP
jgi:hypothetical protein